METTEKTLKVVSKKEAIAEKNEQRQQLVDKLTEKIEQKEKAITTKLYLIEGGETVADATIDFLQNKAQWKFSEALGIMECIRQVNEAKSNITKKKTKEFLIPSLALEAIYYFLTKVEGVGITQAEDYVKNLLKPISDGLSRAKNDREEIDQLMRDRGTLENAIDSGVDVEHEDKLLAEIEQELLKEI
jgi:hypothetical protein